MVGRFAVAFASPGSSSWGTLLWVKRTGRGMDSGMMLSVAEATTNQGVSERHNAYVKPLVRAAICLT